jgi:large subunit ribosomal protein L3
MKFTIGRKLHMTQVFDDVGNVHAVTAISAPGVVVTDILTTERNGYEAIQVAIEENKASRSTKPELGHFGGKNYNVVKEFRTPAGDLQKGAIIAADVFTAGDIVVVSGDTKGKGFQGVMKRHGMHGGWNQHGQKHSHREVGSIGSTGQQRVNKGKRMPGRMGGTRVSVKNLSVYSVDTVNGIILIKGAVPGRRGTVIEIVSK